MSLIARIVMDKFMKWIVCKAINLNSKLRLKSKSAFIFQPNEVLGLLSSLPFSFLRMSLPNFPLFKNAIHYATHENGVAIYDDRMKQSFSYLQLIHAVAQLRGELLAGKR